ncbi:MAG: 4Fe-4S dicluster domain-containing protein [Anaerolineae bacterium]|nr:MAG: 4Fe-4S dicluster domain-containing protein [Anaerolineae bacterium]
MNGKFVDLTSQALDRRFVNALAPAKEKLRVCIQCGTCTASCANAYAMDYTPRQIWRMIQLGLREEVLNSKALWLCSICYFCTLRCPRDIPLTETIGTLKRLAMSEGIQKHKESRNFYRAVVDTIRRHGRIDEVEVMLRYFLSTNPFMAVGYAPLALTLLSKGKVSLNLPKVGGPGKLDRLFRKVEELEEKR